MSSRSFNANINTTDQVNAILTNNRNIGITNIPANKAGYNQLLLGSAQSTTALADSTITPVINTDALPGWTVENSLAGTATVIRMFDSDTNETILKSDITNLYAIVNISKFTSVESLPFITLYTKPTGVDDHDPSYHSKFFYNINILNQHIGVNEEVTIYNGLQEPSRGFTQRKIPLEFVTVIGQDVDGEVLKINFETSAFAVVNDVKLNVSTLGWETRNIKRNINLLSIEEQLPLNDATAANQVLSIASTDAIKTEMTSGEQITKCMGSETGFPLGTQYQIKTSNAGRLEVDIINGASTGDATAALQSSQLTQETLTALNTNTISLATTDINSKISKGADTTLAAAQQVLCYGEVTAGPGTGELHPIHITNAGDVEVEIADFVKGQDTMAASFPVVIASDQSTLPISVATMPLPSGAATETTLSALNTKVTKGNDATLIETQQVGSYAVNESSGLFQPLSVHHSNKSLKVIDATVNTTLSTLNGKVTACDTGAIVGSVSVSSSALPSGAATETTLSAINNKITFGDANTLGSMQCVGIYAERSGGAWAQLQTDISNNLKITNANITKGSDMVLTEAQQVLSYGIDFNGDLRPIKVGDTGRLIVEVDGIRANGSQNGWTIANNTTGTSTEILMNTHTRIAFYGDTNNTFNANFFIEYSQDGVSWFRGSDTNAKVIIISATGNFYDEEIITPPRVRLSRTNNSGAIETVNLYWTQL